MYVVETERVENRAQCTQAKELVGWKREDEQEARQVSEDQVS